ncbi:MAG: hybrid sensor histidine kinase/response regulator [Cyanobacteria bacterium P01_H01_bin.15]
MAYIDDDELRGLFEVTSQERLQILESQFLKLERNYQDAQALDTVLRELHSLKGDSRMLGVKDAETLCHQLEDMMAAVKDGNASVSPALFDRLYLGLDAVRKISQEAVSREPSNINVFEVMAELMGATAEDAALPKVTPLAPEPEEENDLPNLDDWESSLANLLDDDSSTIAGSGELPELDLSALEVPASLSTSQEEAPTPTATATASSTETYRIDTVRVTSNQIDDLANHVAELAVAKLRVERRLNEIDTLVQLWDEWNRLRQRRFQDVGVETSSEIILEQFRQFQELSDRNLDTLGQLVAQLQAGANEDSSRLEAITSDLGSGIQVLRRLPLSNVFNLFPRTIRDLARDQNKSINFLIEGSDTLADKRILEALKDPLTHVLRNAVDHGIETPDIRQQQGKPPQATLRLQGRQEGSRLVVEIIDDGRGLDVDAIRRTALRRGLYNDSDLQRLSNAEIQSLIFAPGFSTRTAVTEISGRGVGLDVVKTDIEKLKGTIEVESSAGKGTTFRLNFTADLSTAYSLLVRVNERIYALPVDFMEIALLVNQVDIYELEGSPVIDFQEQPISLARLSHLLELSSPPLPRQIPCIILNIQGVRFGLFVDELLAQQELVLKPQSKILRKVPNVEGSTILGTGEVCIVLNAQDLLATARKQSGQGSSAADLQMVRKRPQVLLVEDSLPIRTQVRRILEGAGYDVSTAVDGLDGLNQLQQGSFDAVVSDVEMPNLTGLQMTEHIRQDAKYAELPIVLVTTLAKQEDRLRGAQAGANAYLTKGDFDQTLLLDALRRLI